MVFGVISTFLKYDAIPAAKLAVLPLQNLTPDHNLDYLCFTFSDEIAKVLASSRRMDVRPSAMTRRYAFSDLDPQQIGRELHVTNIVSGNFMQQGEHLLVTLEDVDVGNNRVLWGTSFSTDKLAPFQAQLDFELQGLLPILGSAGN